MNPQSPQSPPVNPTLARGYLLGVLVAVARKRCRPANCGSVCLCDSCAARYALAHYAPDKHPDLAPRK